MIRGDFNNREWEYKFYNYLILHEIHTKECTCTYCNGFTYGKRKKLRYGLNIPEIISGWWIIQYWNRRYIRITKFKR